MNVFSTMLKNDFETFIQMLCFGLPDTHQLCRKTFSLKYFLSFGNETINYSVQFKEWSGYSYIEVY